MKFIIVSLLLAATALASAKAQQPPDVTARTTAIGEPRPLTLSDATSLAMRGNPEIAIAEREVSALDAAAHQAMLRPNPSIEVVREGQDRATRSTTVQVSIPLELGGKRSARRGAASLDVALARHELASVRSRIHAEAVNAWYSLYLAGQRLRLAEASAHTARSASLAAARRVLAGKISPVEETRANVAEGAVRIEVLQAKRDWEEARARLTATWGGTGGEVVAVAEPADALPTVQPLEQLMARIDSAPEVTKARVEVERRSALAQVEKSRRVPDVSFIVGAKREGLDDRSQAVVGLSMPIPLFDRNQGAVLESLRRTEKAHDELGFAIAKLRAELAQAHARLRGALDEVALISSDILPGAQSAADAASRGFELGKFSFLEVLDAQRTLYQSKTQYVRAVSDAHRAAADISRILDTVAPEAGPASYQEKQ